MSSRRLPSRAGVVCDIGVSGRFPAGIGPTVAGLAAGVLSAGLVARLLGTGVVTARLSGLVLIPGGLVAFGVAAGTVIVGASTVIVRASTVIGVVAAGGIAAGVPARLVVAGLIAARLVATALAVSETLRCLL